MLPSVVGEDADNTGGHHCRGNAEHSDKGLDFGYLANDFALELLFVGANVAEEQLVFFVSGQLPFIREQAEKTS